MAWRDRPANFAATTLRASFDAARGSTGADRAAAAAVVAVLLAHVEVTERTLAESIEVLGACIRDAAAVEVIGGALAHRVCGDERLATAIARQARHAYEIGAPRSLLVLIDLLLATPASAVLVEEAWGAAALAPLSPSEVAASPRIDRVRRHWAEHRKVRPSWLGELDDEKTDLHPPSFFRARHAELLAIGAAPAATERAVGRYRLLEEIGAGGTATVHLARPARAEGFERWFAVKQLHRYLAEDDAFVQMLLDEARLTGSISHPNVATLVDFGREEHGYWLAMEYLHGEPLSEWLHRARASGQPIAPEIACRIVADAAAGLHAAHELRGPNGERLDVVHRDVNPQNVFVTFDGVTKVVDFGLVGLAKLDASTCCRPTFAGKLAYMSPEQVRGDRLDRRTDVFALGVVLWELTTARRLFRRETEIATLEQVLACDPPRPSELVADYPPELERAIMRALARDPAERFQTARELGRALLSAMHGRGAFVGMEDVATAGRALLADRLRAREACLARHR